MDDLKSSKAESESPEAETTIPEEVQNAPSVNIRPESAISYDEIVSFGFTGEVNDEQNLKGKPTSGYGGSIVVTVRNPSVSGGQLWKSTDETQSADYRLVGPETTSLDTREIDGEEHTLGIEYGKYSFDAEQIEEFDVEYVTLYFNGGLGEYIARRLDAGGGFSYADDTVDADFDEPVPLMEYPSDDSDLEGAVRRQPILRGDHTNGGAIMFEVNGNDAFLGTVFMEDDDGEYIDLDTDIIDSMDHDGYLDTSDVYIGNFAWEDHGESEDESRSATEKSEVSSESSATSDDTVDDTDELTMDFDDGSDDVVYADLDENWQTFIDNAVSQIESGNIDTDSTSVEGLAENFQSNNADMVSFDDVTAADVESIVLDRTE